MAEQNACAENLGANILNDCNDDYGKGVEKIVYIIKKEDIDRKASKITGNVISTLVLRTGKKAYTASAPSNTPFSGLTYEDQNATIGMSFNKTIPIVMLADSPTNALNVSALKQNKYVIIYENNNKGANGEQAFAVIGWEQGAVGQNATLDKYSDDTQGGWTVDMIEEGAKSPQIFFFSTDYETTKAALDSLLSPAS